MMLRRLEDLGEQVENGDITPDDAEPELRLLVRDLAHARMDLVDTIESTPTSSSRDALIERLAEYRRIQDEITGRWSAREQRMATRESRRLTQAANQQTAALVRWTRWLAVATLVLAVATVVLVIVTARSK